ncbi:uncharacterized protein [Aristolochia californica]|uniref:uncharacterized protein n=1 Tax=Aristolochia californica TaxID=171875 RepID=UPI0035D9C0BD
MDEQSPCTISELDNKDVTKKDLMLSVLQLKKGLKQGRSTYIAFICAIEQVEVMPTPQEIQVVLHEYRDVMPEQLPARLPPRRGVDHRIELEPGARKPVQAPYRMEPKELDELRRQLSELLDAGALNKLKEAQVFSKLDLRSGYYKVRIAEGDDLKNLKVHFGYLLCYKQIPYLTCIHLLL